MLSLSFIGGNMKSLVLAVAALFASVPAFSEPVVVDQPIIIMTVEEYNQLVLEVQKLYDEYKKLETAKSCKKA